MRACVCVCVCVCACVTMKKGARRIASTTRDTGDTSSKQQQAQRKQKYNTLTTSIVNHIPPSYRRHHDCLCVCVCVCHFCPTGVGNSIMSGVPSTVGVMMCACSCLQGSRIAYSQALFFFFFLALCVCVCVYFLRPPTLISRKKAIEKHRKNTFRPK